MQFTYSTWFEKMPVTCTKVKILLTNIGFITKRTSCARRSEVKRVFNQVVWLRTDSSLVPTNQCLVQITTSCPLRKLTSIILQVLLIILILTTIHRFSFSSKTDAKYCTCINMWSLTCEEECTGTVYPQWRELHVLGLATYLQTGTTIWLSSVLINRPLAVRASSITFLALNLFKPLKRKEKSISTMFSKCSINKLTNLNN